MQTNGTPITTLYACTFQILYLFSSSVVWHYEMWWIWRNQNNEYNNSYDIHKQHNQLHVKPKTNSENIFYN